MSKIIIKGDRKIMTNKEFIKTLEKDNKRLQEKHENATLKIKLMKEELLESQNYTNELETNNLVYMSHNLALMVENTELKEKLDTLIEENSCLDEDIDIKNIMEENKKLRKTISELENDCINVKVLSDNYKNLKNEYTEENKRLRKTISELENDYIEVKNKNQNYILANTHLQAENKNLKEEVKLFDIERKDFKQAIDFYKKKSKNRNESIIQENAELKKKLENIQTYLNNTCSLNG